MKLFISSSFKSRNLESRNLESLNFRMIEKRTRSLESNLEGLVSVIEADLGVFRNKILTTIKVHPGSVVEITYNFSYF